MRYIVMILAMFFGVASGADAQVTTTDSIFIHDSRPIEFIVNRINVREEDRKWITGTLIPQLQALGDKGIIIGRATASPEGPTSNNQRLARQRRESVDALLKSYGINTDIIRYDVVAEDYPLLRSMMRFHHDSRYHTVDSLMNLYSGNLPLLKERMMSEDGGRLWKHILNTYFPQLRAVRIMAIDKTLVDVDTMPTIKVDYIPVSFPLDTTEWKPLEPNFVFPIAVTKTPRRELLSVKTNLLFDFAYMPGYDRFCPIPNVAIEYYPLHGHFTYGASFDGPWWQHYNAHKYFQIRNYQIHTRYYLRSGDISLRKPGEGAAFKGLFFSAYAHAFIYNICFGERRGWEGEGAGAGLGLGYVVPLGKSEHWRLEFGLQGGFFFTDYDPYQWRCPIDPDSDTKQYYYKWYGDAKDFKKRQHRYTWLGPTRLEITLSYDLLYRKNKKVKR